MNNVLAMVDIKQNLEIKGIPLFVVNYLFPRFAKITCFIAILMARKKTLIAFFCIPVGLG